MIFEKDILSNCRFFSVSEVIITITRSYAALRAADLNWIVGPGYSLGRYILEKNHEKPTWNHEKQTKTNKNKQKQTKTNENKRKQTKTNKNKQKQTKTNKNKQK